MTGFFAPDNDVCTHCTHCGKHLDEHSKDGHFCPGPDPVDDYYEPLTEVERGMGIRGQFPPYGEMLGWIRRWEATLRKREANIDRLHAALLRHGRHVDGCQGGSLFPINACTCGFRQALVKEGPDD